MAVSGKMSKVSPVVATVCIIVYIAAIAFGVVRIIVNMGERRDLAEQEFYDLADRASSSAVFLGFMSEAYQESLKDFIAGSNTLLGVIITGSTGEYALEREAGSGIIWAGNSPRFKTGAGIPGEPFYMPLRIEGQRNVTLRAIYGSFDYRLVQNALKDSLLAVLAALIAAFVTLLLEMNFKNKSGYYKSGAEGEFSTATPETVSARSQPVRDDAAEPLSTDFSGEDLPAAEDAAHDTMSAVTHNVRDTPRDAGGTQHNADGTQHSDVTQNPQGLYAPKGNIGWESYTRDRLASELHRCASFEQDLTFLIMQFPTAIACYRQFADEAVNFFLMRDLIFEKGEHGISVIIPSTDMDQAMAKSEVFRERVKDKLPETFGERGELCVGISSRSGRLINADRLIMEAESALEKALADRISYVVAFKSDPEKYRDFIRQNT